MAKIYKGDVGTVILVDCGVDITGATDTKLMIKKPDQTEKEWSASIEGTTKLKYTVQTGDFDQAGGYVGQAKLTLGTWTGRGETFSFVVHDLWN